MLTLSKQCKDARHGHKPKSTLTLPAIDPIEHEQVKVHVEIERTAESLYQCHGAGSADSADPERSREIALRKEPGIARLFWFERALDQGDS